MVVKHFSWIKIEKLTKLTKNDNADMSNVNFVLKSKSSMFKGFSVNFTALS